MRLLLISNSTNSGEEYLKYPVPYISEFLGNQKHTCAFIPFAGVTISFKDYSLKVKERFQEAGHDIYSVHETNDPVDLVRSSDAVVVGGGNTWQLLKMIKEAGLIDPVVSEVKNGKPYIGWSAGSNMACPTIMTTNDMPVVEPTDFKAFNFIPFQINPHYIDANPEGHAGETREARIQEFIEVNRDIFVLGLREGTMLRRENSELKLIGNRNARIFHYNKETIEVGNNVDLSFLL